jgi:murein DD-endopeptidase MepM/ murein hydrolase activator NlpD
MKKSMTVIGKIVTIMLSTLVITILIGGSPSSISANNDGAIRSTNSQLISENLELKRKYSELEMKLREMEELTEKIYKEDNALYSQILGVDFDTTDFHHYRNDSAIMVFRIHDSVFHTVNDRARYASEMLALQLEKLQATSHRFKNNKNAILYYPTISPIKADDFIELSSPYGWRTHPIDRVERFHEGVDISARVGSDVHATAQGTVVKVMYSKYGYGNRVVIQHAYGFETLYSHLGDIKVRKGQWVRKNQLIGTVGNTGKSTGPHLHYEIHKNGATRDPLGYFYTSITEQYLAMK